MQNTGTWNSDLAIFFFFCLLAPISFHFFAAFMSSLQDISPRVSQNKPRKKRAISVPRKIPNRVSISVSVPDLPKGSVPVERVVKTRRKSVKHRAKPIKRKKPPTPDALKSLTDEVVILDAVSGLRNLGYKKGEAVKIVKSISGKKRYDSVESLVKDCFMCIT